MNKIFKIFGMMMACAAIFTACETDTPDDTPTVVEPIFPEAVETNVIGGEVYTLAIEPNMDWVVTIPETVAAYFQILDGDNHVYTMRGKAGSHEIKINVTNTEDFDADHTCKVSMTMQGETKVIATLTKVKKARELRLYAAQIDENAFVYEADENSDLTFAYQSEEMTSNASAAMFWPEGMGMYTARVKVEANFEWLIDGMPNWIQPIESGKAGVTELWIKGDAGHYPTEASEATLSFVAASNPEIVMATMKVSIPSSKEIFILESFSKESLFNHLGHIFNTSLGEYVYEDENLDDDKDEGFGVGAGQITAIDGVKVCAVAFTKQSGVLTATLNPEWVTLSISDWDTTEASLIQSRTVEYGVTVNGGDVRTASIFVLPADMEADINLMCVQEGGVATGSFTEAYLPYLATTINQEQAPGSIQPKDEDAMIKAGAKLERLGSDSDLFTLFPDAKEAYSLLYTDKSIATGDAALLDIAKTITGLTYYYIPKDSKTLTMMGYSTTWLKFTYNATTGSKIEMDPSKATAVKNEESGDQEGYIVLSTSEGVLAVIWCRYNEDVKIVEEVEPVNLSFYNVEGAEANGSTLVELTEGDLFKQYNDKYGVPVYHLTFTKERTNMSMLTGLYNKKTETPYNVMFDNEADKEWLTYEASQDFQMISMNSNLGNGKTGALVFLNADESYRCVLLCSLQLEENK